MEKRIWIALFMVTGLGGLLLATPVTAQNAKSSKQKTASPPIGTLPDDISPQAAQVVWLHHHNASRDAILHYVNRSHADFKLSVHDVNYLKDIGVSTEIVFAMIRSAPARENIVRLRDRQPHWHVAKNAKNETEAPNNSLANSETLATPATDVDYRQNGVPNNYGPALRGPGYPAGPGRGQYYGVPGQGVGPGPGYIMPRNGYDYRYR